MPDRFQVLLMSEGSFAVLPGKILILMLVLSQQLTVSSMAMLKMKAVAFLLAESQRKDINYLFIYLFILVLTSILTVKSAVKGKHSYNNVNIGNQGL